MKEITRRIKQYYVFFTGYLIFLIPCVLLLISKGKAGSFLVLNSFHRQWLDYYFIQSTNVGNGIFAVVLSLFFFFVVKKKKLGLILLIAYASTGILAQIIKPLVEADRPQTFFSPQWLPFFIKDVILEGSSSFPSGHTATAFALASVLVLHYKNKWLHLLLLLLAVQVGFSRIYLSQHFLTDVMAGSFIGVAGGILCVHWCRNLSEEQLVFKKK